MRFLDFGYSIWDEIEKTNSFHSIIISESFKKEVMRQIGNQLVKKYSNLFDLKLITLNFYNFRFDPVKNNNSLPKFIEKYGYYKAMNFGMFYGGSAMFYDGELTIIDTKGRKEELLPLDREIEKDEYIFEFRFYEHVLPSVEKLVEGIIKRKNIKLFTEFVFAVKMQSPGLDCEIKVTFSEVQTKENKSIFISKVIDAVRIYNLVNEEGKNSTGLIHNIIKVKSEKTTSDSLTFVVDLGSSGEEGLKVFFKAFEESKFEIESVEVK